RTSPTVAENVTCGTRRSSVLKRLANTVNGDEEPGQEIRHSSGIRHLRRPDRRTRDSISSTNARSPGSTPVGCPDLSLFVGPARLGPVTALRSSLSASFAGHPH